MLFIIGKKDVPIYEMKLGLLKKEITHIHHFIAHASLDLIDEIKYQKSSMYLGLVDKHGDYNIYAFLTGANFKFLLLLDKNSVKNENYTKNFFLELYKIFTKVLMNPLYDPKERIKNPYFNKKIQNMVKNFLS